MGNNISPCFSAYNRPLKNQARVFLFPHSGAGASAYNQWPEYFEQSGIDLISVQLPGRENRFGDKAISHLPLLIDNLLSAITPLTDKPFIFFGHSLGALIAFELCRALRRKGLPLPSQLFASAFHPPKLPNPNKELHQLSQRSFIDGIREYGNTPDKVLSNEMLMDILLPMLRADFSLHETYQYREELPLSCPITIFKGSNDTFAKPEDMHHWHQETSASYEEIEYKGQHFFINEHRQSISQRLVNSLEKHQEKTTKDSRDANKKQVAYP